MAECVENGVIDSLRARRMGIDTYQEPVIYMRKDCPVCRSEGFEAQARIRVTTSYHSVTATLNVVTSELLEHGEAGLSEAAWSMLGVSESDTISLAHPEPLESLSFVRSKIHGNSLSPAAINAIIRDVASLRYSDVELSAFLTACAGNRLDSGEIESLTRAMVSVGATLGWEHDVVVDKHSVGGLPGNRTTMIVVPIVTACGLIMPKTSSRAITSPAGTADTMEVLAPVALDVDEMRAVVEREGGCIVWGGGVGLSPADDVLIRIERPLDLDSHGQLVASILSKKVAAGSTHVVIDVPVGATAKVRTVDEARSLAETLGAVARAVGLAVTVVPTDGSQPVGRGIGPALEARDVLGVLDRAPDACRDLEHRALVLAAGLLETAGAATTGAGYDMARSTLESGLARRKFQSICEAQGGPRDPKPADYTCAVVSERDGTVEAIDNRRIARIAKLAGAPKAPAAGVDLFAPIGTSVSRGQPLFVIHAETPGELEYALAYADANPQTMRVTSIEGPQGCA